MTMVTVTYICNAPIGLGLSNGIAYTIAAITTVIATFLFVRSKPSDEGAMLVDDDRDVA